MSPNEIRS
jgi:hypothetical protein